MTRLAALQRLSVASGHVLTDAERDVYLERLTPYADAPVFAALRSLEVASTFFPRLAEIIDAVQSAERSMASDDDPRTWRTCAKCDGSGWEFRACNGRGQCGRGDKLRYEHGSAWGPCRQPHSFAVRCGHG